MKNIQKIKQEKILRRKRRTRLKIKSHSKRLRLSVFRSDKHIYAQIIDDHQGKTLVSASDQQLKGKMVKKEKAFAVGELIAKKCIAQKINKVVFDKGAYRYHGRVAALVNGARKGGLQF